MARDVGLYTDRNARLMSPIHRYRTILRGADEFFRMTNLRLDFSEKTLF